MSACLGTKNLRLLGRDGSAAIDEGGHDTTGRLDTEGERGDVEEVLDLLIGATRDDSGLDSGTISDGPVGVDALVGLLAVEAEDVVAELLEASNGDVEVDSLEQGVGFDGSLGRGREGTLSTLASGTETVDSTSVGRDICKR